MRICFIDESGCTGTLPSSRSDIQPVFVLAGVDFHADDLSAVTHQFIHLKKRFFPGKMDPEGHYLSGILAEIKGADVRKRAQMTSRRKSRHAIGFLDEVVNLLERYHAQIYGRIFIKKPALPFNGRSVYTYSVQYICQWFNHHLGTTHNTGIVICDSRTKALNTIVSHSIFTQKFRAAGDRYPHIHEMPTFGHSENHAGVQIADLLCSALLFPMAIDAYSRGRLTGTHIRNYTTLRNRFAARLSALQSRHPSPHNDRVSGGITIDDKLTHRSRQILFPL